MKKSIILTTALSLGLTQGLFAAKLNSADKMSDTQKQSYAAGFAQGSQLGKMNKDLELDLKLDYFLSGFNDAYGDSASKLNEESTNSALVALQQKIMEKQKAFMEKQFQDNKEKGAKYLADLKKDKKSAVKELDGGVLYQALTSSKSKEPGPSLEDTVNVSYKGTTIDGNVFDSNEKIDLNLKSLIKGWQTALQKMKPGDKWKLYIPYDQAYGENGTRGIMPYSTLVFEIELHKVVKSSDS